MTTESIKKTEEKTKKKIEVLQSEEEKAKNIWLDEEIVAAPEAIDVVSDSRVRPEYDVKYQQFVGTEDAFLQVIQLNKIFCVPNLVFITAFILYTLGSR